MNLQEAIQAKKNEFQSSAPKEILKVMGEATRKLKESGIEERALKEGDTAPDFTLKNAGGELVNLKNLLKAGPVVLGFYRGRW
ncbi:MAG: redoxin domain-containing protein [Deltaproteobacteria bacterium]|nr:redoxin domain-containing protein [Deltaproteobacteria bacterium]